FGRTLFTGGSYDTFVAQRVRERPPGEYNNYKGVDSQALTMLVRAVSGKSLAEYLTDQVWHPMGMQDRAYWTTDNLGVELGLGGLSASARDLAKVGELYLNGGVWRGVQLLDAEWVEAATSVMAPHLVRGESAASKHTMGYGYQWWLPDGDDQDFSAIGIYNQFVYVNPRADTVVVKLSAYRDYANLEVERPYMEAENFSFFRAIARRINGV
ncbi:MAG: serine hydrolase, partial [Pseudomonadota bacterium]